MATFPSRYEEVSRRALLKSSLGLGALALIPGIACGSGDDAEVFAGAQAGAADPTAVPTTSPLETPAAAQAQSTGPAESQAPPTAQPDPTAAATAEPTAVPTAEPVAATTALPAGAVLVVDFSYVQGSGGKNVPPYLAVWVEDSNGELVDTIELWYQQDTKGPRWLPDLKRWFSVDQSRISNGGVDTVDVVSSATRIAGAYSVAWDGLLDTGPAPAGDYFICIESARERGPYSLIREPITLNGSLTDQGLTPNGELQASQVSVRV